MHPIKRFPVPTLRLTTPAARRHVRRLLRRALAVPPMAVARDGAEQRVAAVRADGITVDGHSAAETLALLRAQGAALHGQTHQGGDSQHLSYCRFPAWAMVAARRARAGW